MPQAYKDLRGYTDFTTPGLLFNLKNDPRQSTDLRDREPERYAALLELWRTQRVAYGIVLPQDLCKWNAFRIIVIHHQNAGVTTKHVVARDSNRDFHPR